MNMHTIPIGRMNLIIVVVRELVEVVSEVVGGVSFHVPSEVNVVVARLDVCSNCDLAIDAMTVIVDIKVVGIEPLEAP
jgi:hypothetical protein